MEYVGHHILTFEPVTCVLTSKSVNMAHDKKHLTANCKVHPNSMNSARLQLLTGTVQGNPWLESYTVNKAKMAMASMANHSVQQ